MKIKTSILLVSILAANMSRIATCANVPDQLKVECNIGTSSFTCSALSFGSCCFDNSAGDNSTIPVCYRKIDTGLIPNTTNTTTTTTTSSSTSTTTTTTTTRVSTTTTTTSSSTLSPTPTMTIQPQSDTSSESGLSSTAVAGIIAASVIIFLLIVGFLTFFHNKRKDDIANAQRIDLSLHRPGNFGPPAPPPKVHDEWLPEMKQEGYGYGQPYYGGYPVYEQEYETYPHAVYEGQGAPAEGTPLYLNGQFVGYSG